MAGVNGLESLLSKLNGLKNCVKELEKSIKLNTKFVQGEAKQLCPVAPDGGQLRNSIVTEFKKDSTSIRGIVKTNCEYAAYVEMGTGQRGENSPSPPKYDGEISYREDWSGMDAQPYLYPALKNNEDEISENIRTDLRQAIRRSIR